MVNVSCGYGFWDFIAKRHVDCLGYVVGLDLGCSRLAEVRAVYDDVILVDNRVLSFRAGSFGFALVIEALHRLKGEELATTLKQVREICRRASITSFPRPGPSQERVLEEHRFKKYRYLLRGFILVGEDSELVSIDRVYRITVIKL